MNNFPKKIDKKLLLGMIVLILVFSFSLDIFLFRTEASLVPENFKSASPRVSPFSDPTPRIDDEAASVVRESEKAIRNSRKSTPICATLPAEIWIFLLVAYLFILVFNLSYGFGKSKKIRWFWEGLFTFLAIYAWYGYDGCRTFIWFPLYVMKLGIIIYLFYIYLMADKLKMEKKEEDK